MKQLSFIFLLMVGTLSASANFNQFSSNQLSEVKVHNVSPFCMAIVKGDFETVQKLITLGADINAISNGLTPLMYAAKYNRVDILNLLIEKGVNLKTKDTKKGYTALKFAELSNAVEAKTIFEKALAT